LKESIFFIFENGSGRLDVSINVTKIQR